MFIYEFKSGKTCLITKIALTGHILTLYTSKVDPHELNPMIEQFSINQIREWEPSHIFCHAAAEFSVSHDAHPHQHLRLPTDWDRWDIIRQIFSYLIVRQCTPLLRLNDRDALIKTLRNRGIFHKNKNSIMNFTTNVPYVPENELDGFFESLKQYFHAEFNFYMDIVCDYTEQLLRDNYKILHTKNTVSPYENTLWTYFEILLNFRNILLALCLKPDDDDLGSKANDVMSIIISNQHYDNRSLLSNSIQYFDKRINAKSDNFVYSLLLTSTALTSLFCYCTDEEVSTKNLIFYLSSVISFGLLIGKIANPLYEKLSSVRDDDYDDDHDELENAFSSQFRRLRP